MSPEIAEHCRQIVAEFMSGRVVPFLGAGVNLCGFERTPDAADCWQKKGWLPNGTELSRHLAHRFAYSDPATEWDLMRVSQYASVVSGAGPLYDELQKLFARDYPHTSLHTLLAKMPAALRQLGCPAGLPLIVTTNYDEVLEAAFLLAGEPFDLVSYFIERENQRAKFWHLPNASEHFRKRTGGATSNAAPWQVISPPNTYAQLPVNERTIILKIHGAVDRLDKDQSSFVITEDDYIDFLSQMDFANPLPKMLAAMMKDTHFLFLGYGLRDWNLRVILQRIWGAQKRSYNSWAIQLNPQAIDRKSWAKRNVDLVDMQLEDYVPLLEQAILGAAAPSPAP
jgi:hypothetical protein